MRQQALILIAAVSFLQSATAQERHVFPSLHLVRTYNVAQMTKSSAFSKPVKSEPDKLSFHPPQYAIEPRIQFDNIQKKLATDIRFLRIDKRNEMFQSLFQSGMQGVANKNKPRL